MTTNIKSGISQQPLVRLSSNLQLQLKWSNQTLLILQMKTTCNGRWPQIIKLEYLSNHWLVVGSFQNLKLKLTWQNKTFQMFQMKMTYNGRQPQKSKVEYLSNHLPQIWNLCLSDQIKHYKCFNCLLKDDLKH